MKNLILAGLGVLSLSLGAQTSEPTQNKCQDLATEARLMFGPSIEGMESELLSASQSLVQALQQSETLQALQNFDPLDSQKAIAQLFPNQDPVDSDIFSNVYSRLLPNGFELRMILPEDGSSFDQQEKIRILLFQKNSLFPLRAELRDGNLIVSKDEVPHDLDYRRRAIEKISDNGQVFLNDLGEFGLGKSYVVSNLEIDLNRLSKQSFDLRFWDVHLKNGVWFESNMARDKRGMFATDEKLAPAVSSVEDFIQLAVLPQECRPELNEAREQALAAVNQDMEIPTDSYSYTKIVESLNLEKSLNCADPGIQEKLSLGVERAFKYQNDLANVLLSQVSPEEMKALLEQKERVEAKGYDPVFDMIAIFQEAIFGPFIPSEGEARTIGNFSVYRRGLDSYLRYVMIGQKLSGKETDGPFMGKPWTDVFFEDGKLSLSSTVFQRDNFEEIPGAEGLPELVELYQQGLFENYFDRNSDSYFSMEARLEIDLVTGEKKETLNFYSESKGWVALGSSAEESAQAIAANAFSSCAALAQESPGLESESRVNLKEDIEQEDTAQVFPAAIEN